MMTTNPNFGDKLRATHPSQETLTLLSQRRSVVANDLCEPGPSQEQIEQILTIGARVPDHRKLNPWRFILLQGDERETFGTKLAETFQVENPDANEDRVDLERKRFLRAPVVIFVISNPNREHKTPVWEQELSAGAVCQNILLAANAMGFAGQWITEWYSFHKKVDALLGLTDQERIAGVIYIGSTDTSPMERKRPDVKSLTTIWKVP